MLIIIGIILIIYSLNDWAFGDGDLRGDICIAIIGVLLMIIAARSPGSEVKPVEYPASNYTLEYKVTEYQGRKDTTYVITRSSLLRERELQNQ